MRTEPELRQQFVGGMARLGTAVSVVTSAGPAGELGFTATAVCSVSADPPTLLVCMNRGSTQNAPLQRNGTLCVNVLSADQHGLSDLFAGRSGVSMQERFAQASWSRLATGAPALDGAVTSFDCQVVETHDVATHTVIVGRVAQVRIGQDDHGLVYAGRSLQPVRLAPSAAG